MLPIIAVRSQYLVVVSCLACGGQWYYVWMVTVVSACVEATLNAVAVQHHLLCVLLPPFLNICLSRHFK